MSLSNEERIDTIREAEVILMGHALERYYNDPENAAAIAIRLGEIEKFMCPPVWHKELGKLDLAVLVKVINSRLRDSCQCERGKLLSLFSLGFELGRQSKAKANREALDKVYLEGYSDGGRDMKTGYWSVEEKKKSLEE